MELIVLKWFWFWFWFWFPLLVLVVVCALAAPSIISSLLSLQPVHTILVLLRRCGGCGCQRCQCCCGGTVAAAGRQTEPRCAGSRCVLSSWVPGDCCNPLPPTHRDHS